MTSLAFAHLVLGLLLLAMGRKLFWLFVAAIGFVAGAHAAAAWLHGSPPIVTLGVAVIMGALGAWLAYAAQKLAIALAGFFAGGYLLTLFLNLGMMQAPERQWVSFLLGGIAGAVLMILLFDWTLIVLSSIGGAHLVTMAFHLGAAIAIGFFAALVVCGLLIQSKLIGGPKRKTS